MTVEAERMTMNLELQNLKPEEIKINYSLSINSIFRL